MSGFSADWLALREPFDAAARSTALIAELRAHLPEGTATAPLEVVDLGAGAGSNLRYLAPLLGGEQSWRLVDNDRALLDAALAATRVWAEARGADVQQQRSALTVRAADFVCQVHCEQRDLRDIAGVNLPARGLVTAAALLDLVSAKWLEALARRTTAALAPVCFVLTYDGRSRLHARGPRRRGGARTVQPPSARRQRLRPRAWARRSKRCDKRFRAPQLPP